MNGIEWVHSLTNYEKKMPGKYTGKTFSIDRYENLLERLGSPERIGIPTVQILGTDGKGSTLAFLECLLLRSKKTVKSFISPHLIALEERLRNNGESVETNELEEVLAEVQQESEDLKDLTFFEALNAAFWLWVRKNPPDAVLLETGLGGRLDTTTVCQPALKILTHLERDHIALLGRTMDRIADEKLLGLAANVPTIIAPQSEYLEPQIENRLATGGIPAIWTHREVQAKIQSRSLSGWVVETRVRNQSPRSFQLHLLGDHQVENFSSALLALEILGVSLPTVTGPREISPNWKGRCQVLRVGEEAEWIVDGSHTAMGGQALRAFLDRILPESESRSFAISCARDRLPWCYIRGLVRPADRLCLVDWHHPRIWRAQDLSDTLVAEGWEECCFPQMEVLSEEEIFEKASLLNETWIACGSLYWAGRVLERTGRVVS